MIHDRDDLTTPLRAHDDDGKDKDKDKGPSELERLLRSRTLLIRGEVNGKLAERVIRQTLMLEDDDAEQPIQVVLNSPGGSVTDGMAIYDVLRFVRPRVQMICAGLTASIATIILLAAEKEDRLSLPHARFLIHQPLIMGQVVGPASDLEITANEILKTRKRLNELLAEATGQDFERVQEDTQRDYWMTADEAVDYGLIAGVIRTRSELEERT